MRTAMVVGGVGARSLVLCLMSSRATTTVSGGGGGGGGDSSGGGCGYGGGGSRGGDINCLQGIVRCASMPISSQHISLGSGGECGGGDVGLSSKEKRCYH